MKPVFSFVVKPFVIGCILFSFLHTSAQPILFPYRIKNKFGIADENGKLVVPAKYDEVEYLQPNFFRFKISRIKKDTFTRYNKQIIQDRPDNLYGLIKGNKVLIDSAEYEYFFLYAGFIIGSKNSYRPEKGMVYNLAGRKLLQNEASAIYVNERREVGDLGRANKNLSLLSIYQRDEDRRSHLSIAVYDSAKQTITDWLVKNATDFKLDKNSQARDFVLCSYYDDNGYQSRVLQYTGKGFRSLNTYDLTENKLRKYKPEFSRSSDGNMGIDEVYMGRINQESIAEVPVMEGRNENSTSLTLEEQESRGYVYYQRVKDSVFYKTINSRKAVTVPEGAQLIFQVKKSSIQSEPILFKKEERFGLIIRGEATQPVYDSLIYFGKNFIAGKKTGAGYKYGIIDNHAKELTPFIYDSIAGGLMQFGFNIRRTNDNNDSNFFIRKSNSYISSGYYNNDYVKTNSNTILVYQNGRCGLITNNNEVLLPIVYDAIAENTLSFVPPKQTRFLLLKKAGKYGEAEIENNYDENKILVNIKLNPVLTYIPCFFIDNYWNKKGLRLYGLYNEKFELMGFAGNNGKQYLD